MNKLLLVQTTSPKIPLFRERQFAGCVPVGYVSQTLLCFTVEPALLKLGFQAHKPVNELVNESMSQNAASLTSSETIVVHLNSQRC